MRVDTREFKQIEKRTDPIIEQGEKDHAEYVKNAQSPTADDSEMFVRNTLEDVIKEIQEWFMDKYDFRESTFDTFPSLDALLWHKDGWSLSSAIKQLYETYNRKRDKNDLIFGINRIIETESKRLRNTIFDTANERENRFKYVIISGENLCGSCGIFYGTFSCSSGVYILPPYHPGCECWAIYLDEFVKVD